MKELRDFWLPVIAMVLIFVGFAGWYVHTSILKTEIANVKKSLVELGFAKYEINSDGEIEWLLYEKEVPPNND